MPSYELIYFKGMGRGELARLLFAESGVQYTDTRHEGEAWLKYKPEAPFGQLPVLKVDGKPLAQSAAITRFLAREFGLEGSCNYTTAVGDSIMESLWDAFMKIPFFEKDPEEKARKTKVALEENVKPLLTRLEAMLKDDYFLGKKVSAVDITFMHLSQQLDNVDKGESTKGFPKLKALQKRCEERPGIKKWIANRPVTDF